MFYSIVQFYYNVHTKLLQTRESLHNIPPGRPNSRESLQVINISTVNNRPFKRIIAMYVKYSTIHVRYTLSMLSALEGENIESI